MIVIPQRGSFLVERIVACPALARNEPVFRIAIVFRWNFGAVQMGDGAYFGHIFAAAVERVVDRQEVARGKVVDPLNIEWLTPAGFDERRKRARAVAPLTRGRDIAVDLRVNLLHGDSETALAVVQSGLRDLREWKRLDEGSQLQRVQHKGTCCRARFGRACFCIAI